MCCVNVLSFYSADCCDIALDERVFFSRVCYYLIIRYSRRFWKVVADRDCLGMNLSVSLVNFR